jgi:ribonucleotide reductase alpha subunit
MGACPSFLPPYDLNGWLEGNGDKASMVHLPYEPDRYVMDIKALPPEYVLDAALAIQKWTDAGISAEFLFVKGKATSTNKAVSDLKRRGFKAGLKAMYYCRTVEAPTQGKGSSGGNSSSSSEKYQPPKKPEDGGTCYSCAN